MSIYGHVYTIKDVLTQFLTTSYWNKSHQVQAWATNCHSNSKYIKDNQIKQILKLCK